MAEDGHNTTTNEVACRDVTGLECDYVAALDDSADWAERGKASDQLLTQLTSHISKTHPGKDLGPDQLGELRNKLES